MDEQHDYRLGNGSEMIERIKQHGESASFDDVARTEPEPRGHRPSLAALLTESGIASDQQVKEALEEGLRTGEKLGEVVVRRGWGSEEQLAELLAEQWELSFVKAEALSIDPMAVGRLSVTEARELGASPVWFDNERLVVAVAEPSDERFAAVQNSIGDVGYVIVSRGALDRLLHSRLTGGDDEPEVAMTPENYEYRDHTEVDVFERPPLISYSPPEALLTTASAPDLGGIVDVLEKAAAELRSVKQEVDSLGGALQRANQQAAEDAERRVAAEAARERGEETIRRLEAELAERGDLFSALKTKVAELNQTLDSSSQ